MLEEKEQPFKLERVSIRLVKDAPIYSDKPMNNPVQVVEALGKELCEMDREVMYIINMKTNSVPINVSLVSIGTLNASLVEPRELFKSSILSSAASIVLLHNHPSSDILPSQSDLHLTARLKMAGEIIGIDVLDHIIVGGDNTKYFSFAENNIMPTISYLREAENHEKQISNIAKKPMAAERGKSR